MEFANCDALKVETLFHSSSGCALLDLPCRETFLHRCRLAHAFDTAQVHCSFVQKDPTPLHCGAVIVLLVSPATMADVEVDYGYGDDLDYGYGDTPDPAPPPQDDDDYGPQSMANSGEDCGLSSSTTRRPKRRCSVTKFSLPDETPLNAASIINDMRNNNNNNRMVAAPAPCLVAEDENNNAGGDDDDDDDDAIGNGSEKTDASVIKRAPERQRSGVLRFLKRR